MQTITKRDMQCVQCGDWLEEWEIHPECDSWLFCIPCGEKFFYGSTFLKEELAMPKWTIEYTLPGERGKLHKKSGDGDASFRKAEADIRSKGGNIKSTSFSRSTERKIIPPYRG